MAPYAMPPSQPQPVMSHHSVVPIGGAPFVPPLLTMSKQHHNNTPRSSISTASGSSSSPESSPFGSPSQVLSSGDAYCTSPTSPSSTDSYEAALRYSSALHQHTRQMWERERMNIERARLGLSDTSSNAQHGGNNTGSTSLQKRSTLSGMDSLLGRGRRSRHAKTNSIS